MTVGNDGVTGRWYILVIGLTLVVQVGCGPTSGGGGSSKDAQGWVVPDAHVGNVCVGRPGKTVCDGNTMVLCSDDEKELSRQDCATLTCLDDKGCVICVPGQYRCDGNDLMACKQDSSGWEVSMTCDPDQGQVCDEEKSSCIDLCEKAAETKANVGCEYIAVDMTNVDEFQANDGCFVVIVSNVQPVGNATVTVEDAQGALLDFPGYGTERTVAPGELAVLALTGSAGACSEQPARPNASGLQSGILPGTVFVVKSTLPVVAYQINPYEAANKHTTDASLLIPRAAVGDQYYAVTYQGLNGTYPASLSVVALEDNTTVQIAPTSGLTAGGPVPGGGNFEVTLNALEHLQVMSQSAAGNNDLTGTLITASAPVALFSGDACSNVPPGQGYCDHLEEQIPSIKSWGWTYVAAFPPKRRSEKTWWRIIAAVDNTQVTFEPAVQSSTVLSAGQVMEFETDQSFLVTALDASPDPGDPPPILVMNFLNGAEQTAAESGTNIDGLGNLRGDPAMTLSVPVEQYLNSYVFLSDPSYSYNYVVVVRTEAGQVIHLDCLDPIPDTKFEPVADTYQRAQITLAAEQGGVDGTCQSGSHRIWSDKPFGIWVYGYYADTSYGYPGGMNLEQINNVVVIE